MKFSQCYQSAPSQVLRDYLYLLPTQGTALDLACGLGANALLLARQGLETWAWDYSTEAIQQLREMASMQQLVIHSEIRDVVIYPPLPASFDVIIVSRFLDRNLAPVLVNALKPDGLLFYQTFTLVSPDHKGPKNPIYRLAENELLNLFRPLRIVIYREEGVLGEVSQGFRNEAMLVGQKL